MAPPLTSFWTPRIIATTVQGQWLGEPYEGRCSGVSIDSRAINPGQIFIAIKGDRFDGHDFVDAALQRGAAFAIVDRDTPARPALKVDDALVALQQLASTYRDVLAEQGCKVIAVAGSNGKTTTRHLIHHVLTHAGLHGTQSPKSFNNHIGVPLTLLGASLPSPSRGLRSSEAPDSSSPSTSDDPGLRSEDSAQPAAWKPDDFVVVEVGTNHPGEIAALGQIVRPDIAVITSIGAEHLEFFGDLTGVTKEEASILAFVRDSGAAIVPTAAPWPENFEFPVPVDVELIEFDASDDAALTVSLPGEHNRSNAAAAAAVGRWFDMDDHVIRRALATAKAVDGRSQVFELAQNVTLINDSYNANPDSMRAALRVLQAYPCRRIAILGDMLELGDASQQSHDEIAALARQSAHHIVLIGDRFGGETWSDDLPQRVAEMLQPGDVVLLKASRGMRLERLIPAIESRFAPDVSTIPADQG